MKICYLANTAIPSSNASAIQIVKTCESFVKLKQKVLLITTNVSEKDIFFDYDVKFKFGVKKLLRFKKFPLGLNYYLFSFFSILESFKFDPDIYITRNFFTCFLLIIFRKKTILELHHDLNIESRIVRFLVKRTNFLNSNRLINLIAITKKVGQYYIDDYSVKKKKIVVLPSGSSINPCFNKPIIKKEYNIGYLGSLYNSRGFNLIQKLAKLDKKNIYHVYGDTKHLKNLLSLRNIKNLKINDYVPYREVPKILLEMDIVLMPYTSSITVAGDVGDITKYTSPLKLFDYLSTGKVIICSDISVLKENLNSKINAIFIKNFTNVNTWKMEIQKLVNQVNKLTIISKNNFKHSKNFSHNVRAKKILKIINLSL